MLIGCALLTPAVTAAMFQVNCTDQQRACYVKLQTLKSESGVKRSAV